MPSLVERRNFHQGKNGPLLGIPERCPGSWWIGFKVTDDEVWEKVKDGTYPMFSIEGEAVREEVDDEEPEN